MTSIYAAGNRSGLSISVLRYEEPARFGVTTRFEVIFASTQATVCLAGIPYKALVQDKQMSEHHQISYIEIPALNIEIAKKFFSEIFGWDFVDYGPDYCSFSSQGVDGGFFNSEYTVSTDNGSPLIVLYSNNLESTAGKIKESGGRILKDIFSFPGGRRFHFADPNGNEYAVWSE